MKEGHLRQCTLTTVSSIATRAAQVLSKDFYIHELSGTTTMKEAIQLRWEHLICYKQQDHFKEVDFDTPTANLERRNVHLALNDQHEDSTQKFLSFNRHLSTSRMESQPWDYCGTQPPISFK